MRGRHAATGFPSGAAVVPDGGRWLAVTPAGSPVRDGRRLEPVRFGSAGEAERVLGWMGLTHTTGGDR